MYTNVCCTVCEVPEAFVRRNENNLVHKLKPNLVQPYLLDAGTHNNYFNTSHFSESSDTVQAILAERCDGNRNVLHACVSMCTPTSNKETETSKYIIILKKNVHKLYVKPIFTSSFLFLRN